MYYLDIPQLRSQSRFFLENSEITIIGENLENVTINGSKTEDEYKSYLDLMKPFEEKMSVLYQEYSKAGQAGDEAKLEELYDEYEKLTAEQTEVQKLYIINNPGSYVSPTILYNISTQMEASEIKEVLEYLTYQVSSTPLVDEIRQRMIAMQNSEVGKTAPDFELNDTDGNQVKLSDVIGAKLLLVDFWASWCNPCRDENPNVVAVYNKYKLKGFDVFGVSLDKDKDKWLQAIKDDKLTWTHVSQLEGWTSIAAEKYAVMSIPANFLLDENGIIIAKNLRGEDLENKVKEILEK
jgi:peroxiredoxin